MRLHEGLVSSHFFLRRRQVVQPVFDRPFAALVRLGDEGNGCFRGLPRFLLVVVAIPDGPKGDGFRLSSILDSLRSSIPSSSSSSIFGVMSSSPSSISASGE